MNVLLAETREQLARCFPVMQELRPNQTDEAAFIEQVLRQGAQGYQIAYAETEDVVRAVAGFRVTENLIWGRFLYVDDLVTRAVDRSLGYGETLLQWLIDRARDEACNELHLDSGVQRFEAHRFYLAQRMHITAHHFGLKLT